MIDEFNEHHQQPEPTPPLEATDLKRLNVYDPDFQQRLEELAQLEKISARLKRTKEASQTAYRVREEVGQLSTPEIARSCSEHIFQWFKDKNPYRIDAVLVICADNGIEPTPSIIKLATKVAGSRMFGAPSGSAKKLVKESIKSQVFKLMLNLIHHGETIESAADKAAQWKRDSFPEVKDFKASSLQKEYSAKYRTKDNEGETLEEFYFSRWDKHQTNQQKTQWLKIRQCLALADDDLIGTRR
jgi:hypothetical protein